MRNICILLIGLCAAPLKASEGIPFFRNYTSAEYGGHNRNFDVGTGKGGMVYIANFEGVLSFDNSTWRMTYTPGYSRITRLYVDAKGGIWAGGYNIIAKVVTDKNKRTVLTPVVSDTGRSKIGEVQHIFEKDNRLFFSTRESGQYEIIGDTVLRLSHPYSPEDGNNSAGILSASVPDKTEVNHSICLHNGWQVLATRNKGLIILDAKGKELYAITEANGLCSNSINRIAESENGCVWGVTDNGIFNVYVPSMFVRYTPAENLKGEVTTIQRYRHQLYIGTLRGLYIAEGNRVVRVPSITQACWQLLLSTDNNLYAATSEGIFQWKEGKMRQLTNRYALSIADAVSGRLYIGEMDGIYRLSLPQNGSKEEYAKVADAGQVIRLFRDGTGGMVAKNLLGDLYYKRKETEDFVLVGNLSDGNNLGYDQEQAIWHTDAGGKNIYAFSEQSEHRTKKINECLAALKEKTVRTIYPESDSLIWIGGDFGAMRVDFRQKDAAFDYSPHVFLREVRWNADSVHFASSFAAGTKSISFKFSSDALPVHRNVEYQYRLEGYDDNWSSWSEITEKTYTNLFYGSYTFKVRAKDSFDRYSPVEEYPFRILWPFYLKWYSFLLYILFFAFLVFLGIRWRLGKLVKEKEALERIVAARTRQIREQKEEIEEKSENLGKALQELRHAQADLVRQEKMATVGKLTKGLIDRILNPLNYINNFSHLSSELVNDLRENFNASRATMDPDVFEDSTDILDMMASNLKKIEEHGANTARILKAMEEMLKDRNRQKVPLDIVALCRRSLDMLSVYYKAEIKRMDIALHTHFPVESLVIEGNEEQLGKSFMSLLSNAMYALSKKYAKRAYSPQLTVSMEVGEGFVSVRLKDNGIGIEESIIELIFDPFFTTKTTGEAAGVGLYLSKEIIHNHNGSIQVESRKDEYTEFIIKLPLKEK